MVLAGLTDRVAEGTLEAVVVLAGWARRAALAEEIDHAAAALASVG